MTDAETRGTLKEGEYHPSADMAMKYVRSLGIKTLLQMREVYASTAIEGNRLSEICGETLQRLLDNRPVSDRYLMGLAINLRETLSERD